MKVLQLCFVSNLWPIQVNVTNIDVQLGSNVLDLSDNFGEYYDLVCAAPPCDQFTKANSLRWEKSPDYFVNVAAKCFRICVNSGKPWILENPPGRIESLLPALSSFRIGTWHGNLTNKEYVVYSNYLIMLKSAKRYGKPGSINNKSKRQRELWQPDFFNDVLQQFMQCC
jgi:hypothetical protein